jgi:hypothetical protein
MNANPPATTSPISISGAAFTVKARSMEKVPWGYGDLFALKRKIWQRMEAST